MNNIKAQAIKLYNNGMTMQQIADQYGCSRQYISLLLKNENKGQSRQNKRKIKIYKYNNSNKMSIYIPISYLKAIGISQNFDEEFVNLELKDNKIIITKHN